MLTLFSPTPDSGDDSHIIEVFTPIDFRDTGLINRLDLKEGVYYDYSSPDRVRYSLSVRFKVYLLV